MKNGVKICFVDACLGVCRGASGGEGNDWLGCGRHRDGLALAGRAARLWLRLGLGLIDLRLGLIDLFEAFLASLFVGLSKNIQN